MYCAIISQINSRAASVVAVKKGIYSMRAILADRVSKSLIATMITVFVMSLIPSVGLLFTNGKGNFLLYFYVALILPVIAMRLVTLIIVRKFREPVSPQIIFVYSLAAPLFGACGYLLATIIHNFARAVSVFV